MASLMGSPSTWTFGANGIYKASWDGTDTLTVTVTATGAFLESFSGQSLAGLVQAALQGLAQPPPSSQSTAAILDTSGA